MKLREKTPQEVIDSRFREMSPSEKLEASLALYYSARELKAAWIRSNNPTLTDKEVDSLVKESFMYARS